MRGSVDQRYGLPRYRVWATMAIEDVIQAWRLLIRPCHAKSTPFNTALIAGWLHRCFVDRRPQTEALQEHQSVQSAKRTPSLSPYASKSSSSRKVGRSYDESWAQKSSLSTRTARNCCSSARAQRQSAASFTGNIRNKCSIDANSIRLPTK